MAPPGTHEPTTATTHLPRCIRLVDVILITTAGGLTAAAVTWAEGFAVDVELADKFFFGWPPTGAAIPLAGIEDVTHATAVVGVAQDIARVPGDQASAGLIVDAFERYRAVVAGPGIRVSMLPATLDQFREDEHEVLNRCGGAKGRGARQPRIQGQQGPHRELAEQGERVRAHRRTRWTPSPHAHCDRLRRRAIDHVEANNVFVGSVRFDNAYFDLFITPSGWRERSYHGCEEANSRDKEPHQTLEGPEEEEEGGGGNDGCTKTGGGAVSKITSRSLYRPTPAPLPPANPRQHSSPGIS
ncbi:hypothetical protein DL766_007157 [Monosporascus sp. MC13-8B]|nr:hypothetical protein DL766_007157 [Monosporascus sp. MC13-8B]